MKHMEHPSPPPTPVAAEVEKQSHPALDERDYFRRLSAGLPARFEVEQVDRPHHGAILAQPPKFERRVL